MVNTPTRVNARGVWSAGLTTHPSPVSSGGLTKLRELWLHGNQVNNFGLTHSILRVNPIIPEVGPPSG